MVRGLEVNPRRRTFRPALPSIIMGNGRSVNNKSEELEPRQLFSSLFKNNANLSESSERKHNHNCFMEMVSVDGMYDYMMYFGRLVFHTADWLHHGLAAGRILFKNTFEAYMDQYMQFKLDQVLQEHHMVSLITQLRGTLHNDEVEGPSSEIQHSADTSPRDQLDQESLSCSDTEEAPHASYPTPSHQLDISRCPADGPTQPFLRVYPRTEQGDRKRAFNYSWFTHFTWLEYSQHNDSAYCFACRPKAQIIYSFLTCC